MKTVPVSLQSLRQTTFVEHDSKRSEFTCIQKWTEEQAEEAEV